MKKVDRLTREQAFILQCMSGCVLMPAKDFKEEVEKELGRKVEPSEWNSPWLPEELQSRMYDQFKDLVYNPDECMRYHQKIILPH